MAEVLGHQVLRQWTHPSYAAAPARASARNFVSSPRCLSVAARRPTPAEEAAVDRGQPAADQRHAEELAGRQLLVEQERAEQDRRDRDQEGDEQQVGRAGAREQPEVEHIGERGGEQRRSRARRRRSPARGRQLPGPVDDERQGQRAERSRRSPARRRWPAAARPSPGSAGRRSRRARRRRPRRARRAGRARPRRCSASSAGPSITATPAKPTSTPAALLRGHPLVAGQQVGEEHRPERRRGVEDRGEAGGDVRLAPGDQAEGYRVVERAHGRGRRARPRATAAPAGPSRRGRRLRMRRREPDAQRHQGQRRQFAERHAGEEEGPAPEDGEGDQQPPFGGGHRLGAAWRASGGFQAVERRLS